MFSTQNKKDIIGLLCLSICLSACSFSSASDLILDEVLSYWTRDPFVLILSQDTLYPPGYFH